MKNHEKSNLREQDSDNGLRRRRALHASYPAEAHQGAAGEHHCHRFRGQDQGAEDLHEEGADVRQAQGNPGKPEGHPDQVPLARGPAHRPGVEYRLLRPAQVVPRQRGPLHQHLRGAVGPEGGHDREERVREDALLPLHADKGTLEGLGGRPDRGAGARSQPRPHIALREEGPRRHSREAGEGQEGARQESGAR